MINYRPLGSSWRVSRNNLARLIRSSFWTFIFTLSCPWVVCQTTLDSSTFVSKPSTVEKKWYDSFAIRGYAQGRFNRLLETNPALKCEQCDRSWGDNGGFFFRRIRIIFYGQISKHIYFYVQPDFASQVTANSLNFAQLRDAYMDVGFGKDNQYRLRIGQSKVPFGFENMQSSQHRLPLDRADGLNSAVANERDMGVFFYWAPGKVRKLFSTLTSRGLKGSGDYGVFALGLYNGQTANRPELNNAPHVVSRLSYPLEIGHQIIEPGIQFYSGNYVLPKENLSAGVKYILDRSYLDERFAASFVLYPQPLGFLAEYNLGRGPEFNKLTDSIETKNLHGGFVTVSYLIRRPEAVVIPYARGQYYVGGKKHEQDARSHTVKELEVGVEWQPYPQFELVAAYVFSNRRFEDFVLQNNHQMGRLLRLQAQVNF